MPGSGNCLLDPGPRSFCCGIEPDLVERKRAAGQDLTLDGAVQLFRALAVQVVDALLRGIGELADVLRLQRRRIVASVVDERAISEE